MSVPANRIRTLVERPPRADGDHLVYWMVAARRTHANFGLQRAVELAHLHRKPLLVFEPLRLGYGWASDRFHAFVIEGMLDNAARCAKAGVPYYPYVEPTADADKGLLAALVERAVAVVTDDYPVFFLPQLLEAAATKLTKLGVRLEAVDANGLVPMRATEQVFPSAYAFRRYLQKTLPAALAEAPLADPLARLDLPRGEVPAAILKRWPAADLAALSAPGGLAALEIDHQVAKVDRRGGPLAAAASLRRFVAERLERYAAERSEPSADAVSELSPYLHFGHLGVHTILAEVGHAKGWTPAKLGPTRSGQRDGFWRVGSSADAFLDELVTWRELGFNFASHRADYADFDSLAPWVQETLGKHQADPRPHRYSLEQLERAETHDALWNAAQTQMVREGYMHNYLRMLWGKKVLEWSATPREALAALIHLNNKYELDGRDPNSYSGIFWTLGRYDRPWGPERPIFGLIRYMSSDNTARKLDVKGYLARYGPKPNGPQGQLW